MDKKKKKKLICIIVAAVLLAAGIIIKHTIGGPAVIVLLIPAYVIVGYGPIIKAAKNIWYSHPLHCHWTEPEFIIRCLSPAETENVISK